MVSTRLRRRTTRHAPLLCSVLAMSGAEASPRAKLNSSLHRSAHVLGLLVHLALLSAAGLVQSDDELGWTHVHTSWLDSAFESAGLPAAAAAAAWAGDNVAAAQQHATFRVGKADVDLISKDGRFPSDWTITLHFTRVEEDAEIRTTTSEIS